MFGGFSLYGWCDVFADFCWINKIKQDCMHLFDTEAGATPFQKKER
jgi:hypothetical protein